MPTMEANRARKAGLLRSSLCLKAARNEAREGTAPMGGYK